MNKKKSSQPSFLRRSVHRALFFFIAYVRRRPKLFAKFVRLISRVPSLHAYLKALYHTHNSPQTDSSTINASSSHRKYDEGQYFQRQLERELFSRRQKHTR